MKSSREGKRALRLILASNLFLLTFVPWFDDRRITVHASEVTVLLLQGFYETRTATLQSGKKTATTVRISLYYIWRMWYLQKKSSCVWWFIVIAYLHYKTQILLIPRYTKTTPKLIWDLFLPTLAFSISYGTISSFYYSWMWETENQLRTLQKKKTQNRIKQAKKKEYK